MSKPVLINKTATATEAVLTQVYYGIKLLINDATSGEGNLLIGLGNSVDDGTVSYLMLKPGESIEEWKGIVGGKIYYKSSTGNVPFRFYSEVD